jgi:hypothetical protein
MRTTTAALLALLSLPFFVFTAPLEGVPSLMERGNVINVPSKKCPVSGSKCVLCPYY